jgi:tetratricopeptide (TPR) repeat protein
MPTRHPMKQVICTVALLLSAPTVWAQTAVIRGLVSDITGEPISGVTVTAESAEWRRMEEEATDGAGRFQFIGLQGGRWLFVVRKRGYEPSQGFATVRNTGDSGVIEFQLEFDPLHPPAPSTGVLAGIRADDIQAQLDAAHALFDRGEYDGAIAAYKTVLEEVPRLTSLNLQIGHAHREKQNYDQALAAYQAVPVGTTARKEAESAIQALAPLGTVR